MNTDNSSKKMVHWTDRFQKIMVDPTNVEETIQILKNIKSKYEEHHQVRYSDKGIDEAVRLSDRLYYR